MRSHFRYQEIDISLSIQTSAYNKLIQGKHHITGENITQLDFVKHNPRFNKSEQDNG